MTLLDLIENKPGFKKQSANTWEGPCPKCGGSKRFVVWTKKDIFKCRECDFKGDLVKYLREAEGYTCREAFLAAGKECGSTDCPAYEKCKGNTAPRRARAASATPPDVKAKTDWQPRAAEKPLEMWRRKAAELVDWAHEQLLASPERLDYLASRGLPLEAVKKYRLGWNPGEDRKGKPGPLFKKRAAWGLEDKRNEQTGKTITVLAIQRGYIIPSFQGDDIYRIRIRRPDEDLVVPAGQDQPPKYLFLEGSGKGLVIRDREALAYIVVESDFDDLLIDNLAGDIICSVALTSCGIRPDAESVPVFAQAVCLLNSLDYDDLRKNAQTGKYESPGGQNAQWWRKHFPICERWPPPIGKDPGEAWKAGVDIRRWILDGLPISLHPRQAACEVKKTEAAKVTTILDKMHQILNDSTSRLASSWRDDAWEWLEQHRPNVVEFISDKKNSIDGYFAFEDEAGLVKALEVVERAYERAWQVYDQRPPVIERQESLFEVPPQRAE